MKRTRIIIAVGVLSFLVGALVSPMLGWRGPERLEAESEAAIDLPAAVAQVWFPSIDEYDNGGEVLDDEQFKQLMAALDAAMSAEETVADFAGEASFHLANFARRLVVPRITEPQQEVIADFLAALGEQHPDHLQLTQRQGTLLTSLYPPKPTDDIPVFSRSVDLLLSNAEFYADGGDFEDGQVDRILATLRAILNAPEVSDRFEEEAATHLRHAGLLLQFGRLSPEQLARVLAYMDEVAAAHPETDVIADTRYIIENLTPGRVAPNITGKDTDGVEFSLEDYRGKVVALVFSGHWCGPCRVEYPFQRAMVSLYEDTNEDAVLLSVNSDPVLETIRAVKVRESLAYRTWWDGHEELSVEGPIATEWRVGGWPTIYILDEKGVIRYVDRRGADMIAAVDELLKEKRWAALEASMLGTVEDPEGDGK